MTTEEVAELARTSPETVRYWRHRGKPPGGHFRVGRRVLYDREIVEAWLKELQVAGNAAPSATSAVSEPRPRAARGGDAA